MPLKTVLIKPPDMSDLAVSILGADFMHLADAITLSERVGDRLHVDVMDGHFVPNLSFGFPVLESLKTTLPVDIHLMISNPQDYAGKYAAYGEVIFVPAETGLETWQMCADQIRRAGKKAGIVLNPKTPVESILPLLESLTHVLVMSVEPGFGGQKCQTGMFAKIAALKERKPSLIISVDGGIDAETAPLARAQGADVLVSGSFILKAADPMQAASQVRGASTS